MNASPFILSPQLKNRLNKHSSELARNSVGQCIADLNKKAAHTSLSSAAPSPTYTGQPPEPSPQSQHPLPSGSPAAFTVQVLLPNVYQRTDSIADIAVPILTPAGNIRDAAVTL